MGPNGSKIDKMYKHPLKWFKMGPNGSTLIQIDPNQSKIDKIYKKHFKAVQNGPKMSRTVHTLREFNKAQNGIIGSIMVRYLSTK